VIVDEIHTVCGEKRGSFLALLLERLEQHVGHSLVRVGLSATQRPLERVARYLGGYDAGGQPRPVAIIDCGMRKDLDLAVISPVRDMRLLPRTDTGAPSIWPAIYERLHQLALAHTSTLIFANNRRAVERIASEINRLAGRRLARAHHGSVSKEYRQEIEGDLKAGRLQALVATASLELGIDMGAIDLVCQVECPTSVASGLQRVGRAGHAYRRTSVGRMIPKTRGDLLRMAGMSRCMLRGEISEVHIPENPLDVLAQQMVAMIAVEDWDADALYSRVGQAAPFHGLPRSSFDDVLEMISGGYASPAFPSLRARIVWERSTGRLSALPGAFHAAILSGGTIPDTGQYAMVLEDGKTRLGELDEEFVFERRLGDTFVLGTNRWRIVDIRHDRVVVSASGSDEAQLPFWKGEGLGHDAEFGERWGAFVAECAARRAAGGLEAWLQTECALDTDAARSLGEYIGEQMASGALPDDSTILVDVFPNEMGDLRVAVVSTFGRAFHLALWLAMRGELRRAGHEAPEGILSNDGILFRLGPTPLQQVLEAIERLQGRGVRDVLTEELLDSPYYALRFRRNAGRALLLPRSHPGQRVPLWLQRLRSHDLLAYASAHPRFPLVAETHREILDDVLPVASLERFLSRVARGETRFAVRRGRSPSPFSTALLLDFAGKYMYEADRPASASAPVDRDLLAELLRSSVTADLVAEEAVRTMEDRLQGLSAFHRARDAAEVVELLQRIGDLTDSELRARCEPEAVAALEELLRDGRVRRLSAPLLGEERLVAADDAPSYEGAGPEWERIFVRYASAHAGRTEAEILARYPGAAPGDLRLGEGRLVRASLPGRVEAFVDRDVLVGLRRMTLSTRRREPEPVSPTGAVAAVLRRQHVTEPLAGAEGLRQVLDQLTGWLAPVAVWPEILCARVQNPERIRLEPLMRSGALVWRGWRVGGTRVLGFASPEAADALLPARDGEPEGLAARAVEFLTSRGASFLHQVVGGLAAPAVAVDEALWELTWRGWVTNDSLVAAQRPGPGRGRPTPGLERWAVVEAPTEGHREDQVAAILRALAARYGLLTRELVNRDPVRLRWSEAYPALSQMEWRGDVDRGLHVSGLGGPQFAVPEWRASVPEADEETRLRLLHVMDPAYVLGELVPSPGLPRRGPGTYVIVRGGRPLISVEAWARKLSPLADLDAGERREALSLLSQLVRRVGQRPSIRVDTWDGAPATDSVAANDLAALGFIRDDQAMVLYRSYRGVA
jgi:ATP-dependent Lhr-like helicase